MYQQGDRVVYGIHCVCRVADVEMRMVDRKTISYLVLEPLDQAGAKYLVPMGNQTAMAKLRPILEARDMEQMLSSQELWPEGWVRDEQKRKQLYRELISGADWPGLLRMVRSLCQYKQEQTTAGKRLHMNDENFLRDVQKLLAGEMAVVLDQPVEQTREDLRRRLR